MFVFQAGKKAQKIREEEISPKQYVKNFLTTKGVSLGGAWEDFFNFLEKKGESADNPYLDIIVVQGEEKASKLADALTILHDYIAQYFGVDIKISRQGNIVSLERVDVIPQKPEIAGVPSKLPQAPAPAYQPPQPWEEVERAKEELGKKYPTVVEFHSSQEKDYWLAQRDPKKEEWEVVGPFRREFDDTLHAEKIRVYATSMGKYTAILWVVPDYIHKFGFYIDNARTYNAKDASAVRDNLGTPGGFLAALFNGQADFLTHKKHGALVRSFKGDPRKLAAFLSRGWTGVLYGSEKKTISKHYEKIEELMEFAKGSFDNLRGVLPDDSWVAFKVGGEVMADYAIQLGLIDESSRDDYANAFAFGMLEISYFESGLSLKDFFAWYREEDKGRIDPDTVITNIMKERDEYRLFYGAEEITEPTEIVFSPYKDLMIADSSGNMLAHLRITHSNWLYNKKAWDGNKDYSKLIQEGVFKTSVSKWSWLGIGMTSFYHPVNTEISFDIVPGISEEVWLGGVKPKPEEIRPPEERMANAFSIVGDREFRIVGTGFKTNGRIIAYGETDIKDLRDDPNFSLNYIAYSSPLPKQEMWFPGLRGKKERYVAYIPLPAGDPLQDRLPEGIKKYDKGMQNAAFVYEDYRYDLILTTKDGKQMNVLPGVSVNLIQKGLKPEYLQYEINPDGTYDIYVCLNKDGEIVRRPDPEKIRNREYYIETIATGVNTGGSEIVSASFVDNKRTGLDIYAVIKLDKDGTATLQDAARIVGHEFDYKWLDEKGYRKVYLGSLPSSRVVETAPGEKSYHILPTDISSDWQPLLVGTIPPELIRVSADGKTGEFTAELYPTVAVQKGIKNYYVTYYMNYKGKPPVSFDFAGLPVSVETLASKDAETRKAAISQLLSLSQNPMSSTEASDYMGLISEVEGKWRDRLDEEDRKNLAAARANFERYSGIARGGEIAAGVSERLPTLPEPQYTLSMNQQSITGLTTADIPSQWDRIWGIQDDQAKLHRFSEAVHALGVGLILDVGEEREKAKQFGYEFLKAFIPNPKPSFEDLTEEEKNAIAAMVYGKDYGQLGSVQKTNVAKIYSLLINGNIKELFETPGLIEATNLEGIVDPISKMEFLSKINENVMSVGDIILDWRSGGTAAGELGAPTAGLAANLGAFVDFIDTEYKRGRLQLIKVEETDPETGEKKIHYAYGGLDIADKRRLGIEPRLRGEITARLPSGIKATIKGGVGYRAEFEKGERGRGRWTSNVGMEIGDIRIPHTNVVLLINGDWGKIPALRGMEERTTVSGTASFNLLVPHSATIGLRRSVYTREGEVEELSPTGVERTGFAVLTSTLYETPEGRKLSSNLSAEVDRLSRQGWKRWEIGGEYQVAPGKTFYAGIGRVNTQLGIYNTFRIGFRLRI